MFGQLGSPARSAALPALAVTLVALALPLTDTLAWQQLPLSLLGPLAVAVAAGAIISRRAAGIAGAFVALAGVATGAVAATWLVHADSLTGHASWGFWCYVLALGLLVWRSMSAFSKARSQRKVLSQIFRLLVPGIFGIWLIVLWELVVVGFGVPRILLPAPSMIGDVFVESGRMLTADFHQTVIRSVIPGFVMGNVAGFLIAVIVERVMFLKRGLLPLGNLISAIPIVGIAPIMVMWFGFDWQSKAAVVVIMTFFPMLVNTVIGLSESTNIEIDLMRSYGARYWQEFFRLRLPNALPFVFNALKINSTLALIGAIVAEFFGTPIVGMGFRISTEVGRMSLETVWATIAVAALSGSSFYGLLALLERRVTFWHASFHASRS
ncbi:MAG TPA: nitrate ABC transporter [Gammaproteobacteria bacterium]|jgi:NitT/TauT family transport system permease protein|nr:ABC transporter permease [Arenicellales bacterium]HCY12746.1 nitrate ABC transporter [Gammaproteobacteria bacterium]|tara:strand:- start:366 stop:1508 length:1143 start_codon:yes stop_codon:yes gene_type:complete